MKNKEGTFATHPDLCKSVKTHVDLLKQEGQTWKYIEEHLGLQYPAARNIFESKTLGVFNQFRFKTSQIVKMQDYCKMNAEKIKTINVDDLTEKIQAIQEEKIEKKDEFGFNKNRDPNKNMFRLLNLVRDAYEAKPDNVELTITLKA
jgi:hypothetical protein